jgi:hypothetical protein
MLPNTLYVGGESSDRQRYRNPQHQSNSWAGVTTLRGFKCCFLSRFTEHLWWHEDDTWLAIIGEDGGLVNDTHSL